MNASAAPRARALRLAALGVLLAAIALGRPIDAQNCRRQCRAGETRDPRGCCVGGAAPTVERARGDAGRNPAQTGSPSGTVLASCREVLERGLSHGDGLYVIRPMPASPPTLVHCLMSADGGCWTLVANYPAVRAGAAGWNDAARVGAAFDDLAVPFKLADDEINAMRTSGFRVRAQATRCLSGPCAIDVLLFWRPTCRYASHASSPACAEAFYDIGFAAPTGNTRPCAWHWGLTDAVCGDPGRVGVISSHRDNGIAVGDPRSSVHAYNRRGSENPSIQIWVR